MFSQDKNQNSSTIGPNPPRIYCKREVLLNMQIFLQNSKFYKSFSYVSISVTFGT